MPYCCAGFLSVSYFGEIEVLLRSPKRLASPLWEAQALG